MIIPSFAPLVGGAERQLEGLVPALQRRGCEVTVVTRRLTGTPAIDRSLGYEIIRLPHRGPWGFNARLELFLLLRGRRFDLFHCHTLSGPALVSGLAAFLLRRPIILKVTRSGPGSQLRRWRNTMFGRRMLRVLLLVQSHFVALTREASMELTSLGVASGRITEIPNGVAIPPACPRPATRTLTFAYVGRLIARKRVGMLVRAFVAAERNFNADAQLRIIGGGEERTHLQALVAELGIRSEVVFCGELDHDAAIEELEQTDVFVLPSDSEGMSNSLLEAMSAGCAVVCSDIPVHRELIQNERTGLLFSSEPMLQRCLERLMAEPELRQKLGRDGADFIASNHSFDAVSARYLTLYRRSLGAKVE